MRLFTSSLTLVLLTFTNFLNAAIPPLSQESRVSFADDIISGRVLSTSKNTTTKEDGTIETNYRAAIIVTAVEKSDDLVVGDLMYVDFQRIKLPEGYTGRVGQNQIVKPMTTIKAYLQQSDNGYDLLEPNGFDILSPF